MTARTIYWGSEDICTRDDPVVRIISTQHPHVDVPVGQSCWPVLLSGWTTRAEY